MSQTASQIQEKILSQIIGKIKKQELILCTNSRNAQENSLFVSFPLQNTHITQEEKNRKQIEFILHATKAQALILCEKEIGEKFCALYPELSSSLYKVENVRKTLGEIAAALYESDTNSFPLIAITGTNGKTTLSYLIEFFFHSMHKKVGLLGTVSYRYDSPQGKIENEAPLTTPDCLFLHKFFHIMQEAHCDIAIMEASSHALEQERLAGLKIDVAVFTNLTQDHLDYHANMDEYFLAKAKLFAQAEKGIINADDQYGQRLLKQYPASLAFSLQKEKVTNSFNNIVYGTLLSSRPDGLEIELNYKEQSYCLKSHLIGQHNASNILALVAIALSFGYTLEDCACIENFLGVSGRLERVPNKLNIHAFVDYAHTPDALFNTLTALKTAGFEHIISVVGCGGDRDKTKRPLMAKASASLSSISILSSDNPRTEDPEQILNDMEQGLDSICINVEQSSYKDILINKESHQSYRLADRKKAIFLAFNLAQKLSVNIEDKHKICVLVAGKGHENYQIIGTEKIHFSDQEVIKELICC